MSEFLVRCIFAAVFAIAMVIALLVRYDREVNFEPDGKRARYGSYLMGSLLLGWLLGVFLLGWKINGLEYAKETMLSLCFQVFLHIAIYYAVLFFLMPKLRRRMNSMVCAMLWFLPTYLYLFADNGLGLPAPLLIISIPNAVVKVVAAIWFAGFVAVLLWRIISHFVFRRRILADARQPELAVRQIWALEQQRAMVRKMDYPVLISPHVKTPLTIGLFRWSICIVLPERSYTKEELHLIFRHELVHLCRSDGSNKFFIAFCTAMCWFNPLMWKAMRSSAEDMELSCDEAVLMDADEETRQLYARLLLRTSGDERGFTTCLAASAEAMRYRLKNVVKPVERESGALIVAGIFFILIVTYGWISLGYEQPSGHELIFSGHELSQYTVSDEGIREEKGEELTAYLASLEFEKFTGEYTGVSSEHGFDVVYQGPEGSFWIILLDDQILIQPFYDGSAIVEAKCRSEIDWDYLETFLSPYSFQYN